MKKFINKATHLSPKRILNFQNFMLFGKYHHNSIHSFENNLASKFYGNISANFPKMQDCFYTKLWYNTLDECRQMNRKCDQTRACEVVFGFINDS